MIMNDSLGKTNAVIKRFRHFPLAAIGLVILFISAWLFGHQQSTLLAKEDVRQFLLTGEIIRAKRAERA